MDTIHKKSCLIIMIILLHSATGFSLAKAIVENKNLIVAEFTGQNPLDSLKQLLKNTKSDEEKLMLLNQLVDVAFKSNLHLAKDFATEGINQAIKSKNKDWLPKFYEMKGRMHANLVELDSATFYFDKALLGYIAVNNQKGQATTYFKMGWVFKKKGDLEQALQIDLKALKIMENLGDREGIAGAYNRVTDDLIRQGRLDDALQYAMKTIDFCQTNNLDAELSYAYTMTGNAHIHMGNNEEALKYYDLALELALRMDPNSFSISDFRNDKGNALKRLGRYEEAIVEYQQALDLAKKANYNLAIAAVTANLGEVNLLRNNYAEALIYQLETVRLQEEAGDMSNLTENLRHVSTIYEKMGKYAQSLEYQKKAFDMQEKTVRIERDNAMAEMMTRFETEKKDQTINDQEKQIAQQRKTQLLIIGIVSLLVLGLLGMFLGLNNIRKKRSALQQLNTELDTKNRQNELLLKEIHHRVKNNLELVKSLISLQSSKLEDSASKDAMIASQNRVQSMGLIHQKLYQGENLGSIDMKDYFINLSEGILDSFNAEDKVKIECVMEHLELDVDTAVPIGLIVNELLTNSLKYAFPDKDQGQIKISLEKINAETLKLSVSDNGIGKGNQKAPNGTGFGTQLIHLLTQQLNGEINEVVRSGTIVSFEFKLKMTS